MVSPILIFLYVYNLRLNDLFGQPFVDDTFVFRVFSDKGREFDSNLRVEALSNKEKAMKYRVFSYHLTNLKVLISPEIGKVSKVE